MHHSCVNLPTLLRTKTDNKPPPSMHLYHTTPRNASIPARMLTHHAQRCPNPDPMVRKLEMHCLPPGHAIGQTQQQQPLQLQPHTPHTAPAHSFRHALASPPPAPPPPPRTPGGAGESPWYEVALQEGRCPRTPATATATATVRAATRCCPPPQSSAPCQAHLRGQDTTGHQVKHIKAWDL